MGMTRDEAIKIWNDPSRNAIDALVDLGVLKLDEPAKKVAPLELAMLKLGFAAFQAEAVRKQLEHHGFQIVEKNDAKEAAIRRICEWANTPSQYVDLAGPARALRDACK